MMRSICIALDADDPAYQEALLIDQHLRETLCKQVVQSFQYMTRYKRVRGWYRRSTFSFDLAEPETTTIKETPSHRSDPLGSVGAGCWIIVDRQDPYRLVAGESQRIIDYFGNFRC
jgi:hypothetical protein